MSRVRKLATIGALLVVALLLSFPPFMVIDRAAPAPRHASLGHHPLWRPPTPDTAEERLSGTPGSNPTGGQSSLRIGVNRVRLGAEVGATLTVPLLTFALDRVGRRGKN